MDLDFKSALARLPPWRYQQAEMSTCPGDTHGPFDVAAPVEDHPRLWHDIPSASGLHSARLRGMCGRFTLARSPEELTRVFGLSACADFAPHFNIAPATDIAVVRRSSEGARVLHLLRWGLIPNWSKDPKIGSRLINARGETVMVKPSWLWLVSGNPGEPRMAAC
jgi:hypothetical protein